MGNCTSKNERNLENLLKASDLSLDSVTTLVRKAEKMKRLVVQQGGDSRLAHRVLGSIFYEPSTRTSCSFTAAMMRLGGSVMPLSLETSSQKKGEVFEDTIQTMACYCDAIVIRHPTIGHVYCAAQYSNKPIINAGEGVGEHPTQALLDVYTIFSEIHRVGNFTIINDKSIFSKSSKSMRIVMLGDLKHGRTVHSLVSLLSLFEDIHIEYVSPHPKLDMPTEIVDRLREKGVPQTSGRSLDEAITEADVLYVTRLQEERKERFSSDEEYEEVRDSYSKYCINNDVMKKAKKVGEMVVMHPLPRGKEMSEEVDSDPRAAYIRQMENGMYMRMALLDSIIRR
jgi:aspartate carbamoyltransferase